MNIRQAETRDIPALTDIYNYEVTHGVATLDIHPRTYEDRAQWFNAHNKDNHPLIVAEDNGEVIGYASLSPYREKEAYSSTVELSVYVDALHRGKGVASALLMQILDFAKNDPSTTCRFGNHRGKRGKRSSARKIRVFIRGNNSRSRREIREISRYCKL